MQTRNRPSRSGRTSHQRRAYSPNKERPSNNRFSNNRPQRRDGGRGQNQRRRGGGRGASFFDPSRFINTNPVDVIEEIYTPKHSFETLGFNQQLLETISKMGITSPTPIQDQIIPEILKNRDVIGIAETGTGKTAAFLLPLIEKTIKDPKRQTLILAPTRELAIQIEDELRKLSRGFKISSVICVGGINIRPQINMLRNINHFVIGTPGRILDLIKRKHFKPERVTTLVLDEADRMLDMGFIHDMKAIISSTPKERETLFFSATTTKETHDLIHNFLRDPITISVKKKDVIGSIKQDIVSYGQESKFEVLSKLFSNDEFKRVIIFCAMKHGAEKLSRQLSAEGVRSASIHGNKNHSQRQHALRTFKIGNIRALVATDVAARGIHVDDVSHVINYDLPKTFDDYVHRIGRTGRATKSGKALTFVQTRSNKYRER